MTTSTQAYWTVLLVLACMIQCAISQRLLCGRALADTLDMVCAGRGFHLGKRSVRHIAHHSPPALESDMRSFEPSPNHNEQLIKSTATENIKEANRPQHFLSLLKSHLTSEHQIPTSPETQRVYDNHNDDSVVFPTEDSAITSSAEAMESENLHQRQQRLSMAESSSPETNYLVAKVDQHVSRRRRRRETSVVDECCYRACTFATLESYCAVPDEPVVALSMSELGRRLGLHMAGDDASAGLSPARSRPSAEIIRNGEDNGAGPFFYLSFGNQATRSPLIE